MCPFWQRSGCLLTDSLLIPLEMEEAWVQRYVVASCVSRGIVSLFSHHHNAGSSDMGMEGRTLQSWSSWSTHSLGDKVVSCKVTLSSLCSLANSSSNAVFGLYCEMTVSFSFGTARLIGIPGALTAVIGGNRCIFPLNLWSSTSPSSSEVWSASSWQQLHGCYQTFSLMLDTNGVSTSCTLHGLKVAEDQDLTTYGGFSHLTHIGGTCTSYTWTGLFSHFKVLFLKWPQCVSLVLKPLILLGLLGIALGTSLP